MSTSNYGKPLGNYSAVMVVDAILDELRGRKGFGHLFDEIECRDEELEDESEKVMPDLRAKLENIVQQTRHAEDERSETYGELRHENAALRSRLARALWAARKPWCVEYALIKVRDAERAEIRSRRAKGRTK